MNSKEEIERLEVLHDRAIDRGDYSEAEELRAEMKRIEQTITINESDFNYLTKEQRIYLEELIKHIRWSRGQEEVSGEVMYGR